MTNSYNADDDTGGDGGDVETRILVVWREWCSDDDAGVDVVMLMMGVI